MKKMIFKNVEESIKSIQTELAQKPEGKYSRRLHSVLLLLQGLTAKQVAQMLDIKKRTIMSWGYLFKKEGIEGLKDGYRSGRPRILSVEEMDKLALELKKPTSKFGYNQGAWDGPLLQHHLEKQYDVRFSVRQCQRIFHQLNMSLKRPRPKMAGASEEAQEAFKKKLKNY